MKHFKIIGPETTREFDIDDNEMLEWRIYKIYDFMNTVGFTQESDMQNVKFYPTEKV